MLLPTNIVYWHSCKGIFQATIHHHQDRTRLRYVVDHLDLMYDPRTIQKVNESAGRPDSVRFLRVLFASAFQVQTSHVIHEDQEPQS